MEIPVLYDDAALVVCLKPPGADSEAELPALLLRQLGGREVLCVHRLDRAVGGVMVFARSRESAAALSRQMGGGAFQKDYLAVVHGRLPEAEGELRDLLFHDRAKNKSYVVTRKRAGVREAALRYRALEEAEGLSLLSVRLITGRTHQIRVQFASRAHPLVGDARYGSPARETPVALYSCALAFRHPETGKALRFTSLPPDAWPWTKFHLDNGGLLCDTSK